MVGGPHGNPVEGEVPPPRLRQPRSGALEAAKRRGAERHEDPRSDGLDLAPEVRPTRFQFVRLRRPVRGGRHLTTFVMKTSFREIRAEVRALLSTLPADPTNGRPA